MLVQQRRAWIFYHEALEAGLPILPDIGWSLWEPDGRLWAEWVNAEPGLHAVSIFCGGKRIHAERRAYQETVEDLALFHQAVRHEVAFVLGGVHSPPRTLDHRRATAGRQLGVCNGQAYALAQRRRLLGAGPASARSARECFLSQSPAWTALVSRIGRARILHVSRLTSVPGGAPSGSGVGAAQPSFEVGEGMPSAVRAMYSRPQPRLLNRVVAPPLALGQ